MPIFVPLHLLLLLNLALAAYLTGLIWTVQVVHYPGLALLGKADFPRYHAAHTRRMGYVAGPPMVLELALTVWLAVAGRGALPHGTGWWSLGLVGLAWAVTFFISVPFHSRLSASGYDYIALDGLARTNWLRTLAWTARLLLLGWLLAVPCKLGSLPEAARWAAGGIIPRFPAPCETTRTCQRSAFPCRRAAPGQHVPDRLRAAPS